MATGRHAVEDYQISWASYQGLSPMDSFPTAQEIGCFSTTKSECFTNDRRNLRQMRLPGGKTIMCLKASPITKKLPLPADRSICNGPPTKMRSFDGLLRFLQTPEARDSLNSADFVSVTGDLVKLLVTPYATYTNTSWEATVTKFRGVHYMRVYSPQFQWTSKGSQFEDLMTAETPTPGPTVYKPMAQASTSESSTARGGWFHSVLKTKIGDHSLLYAGEIDCCATETEEDTRKVYIELKSAKIKGTINEYVFNRSRMPAWWAQCFLLNVPHIVCGFHEDNKVVREIKLYNTCDLHEMNYHSILPRVRECSDHERLGLAKAGWTREVCITFLDRLLSYIKSLNLPDDIDQACVLSWGYRSDYITVERNSQSGNKVIWEDLKPLVEEISRPE